MGNPLTSRVSDTHRVPVSRSRSQRIQLWDVVSEEPGSLCRVWRKTLLLRFHPPVVQFPFPSRCTKTTGGSQTHWDGGEEKDEQGWDEDPGLLVK